MTKNLNKWKEILRRDRVWNKWVDNLLKDYESDVNKLEQELADEKLDNYYGYYKGLKKKEPRSGT